MSSIRSRNAGVRRSVGGSPARAAFSLLDLDRGRLGAQVVRPRDPARRGPRRRPAARRPGRPGPRRSRPGRRPAASASASVGGRERIRRYTARIRASAGWSFRQSSVMALSSESRAMRPSTTMPLASSAGWSGVVASSRTVIGSCRDGRQPKVSQHVDQALDHRQRQGGRSRSFEVEANSQARRGVPRLRNSVGGRRPSGSRFSSSAPERLADGREQRIDQLLGRHPPPRRRGRRSPSRAAGPAPGRPAS